MRPNKSATAREGRGSTLVGIFIGLVIGVVIAAFVVWLLNRTPVPLQDKTGHAERREAVPGQAPMALPGKPGDKTADKPRFDFYKILPGGQEAGSAAAPNAPAPAVQPAAPSTTASGTDTIFLQAGAFQKTADADNLKAKLALMGVEAGVQEISVPDKGTMYRVRVGPFTNLDEMNRVRGQLSQNGVQTSVVKIKPAAN